MNKRYCSNGLSPLTKRKKQNEFRRNESFLMIKYEPIRWIFVGFGFISDGLKSVLTIKGSRAYGTLL